MHMMPRMLNKLARAIPQLSRCRNKHLEERQSSAESPQLREYQRLGEESGCANLVLLLSILESQYGHRGSAKTGRPVDKDGYPLPWYTYPAIDYLRQLDLSQKTVFEFGGGNSSLFYASRVKKIISIDNNAEWVEVLKPQLPTNAELYFRQGKDAYVHSLREQSINFDIIVIDGSYRRACASEAISCLAPDGLIILDNSDWFPKTAEDLRKADLIQIDFTGFGPVNYYTWTTSLFLQRSLRLLPLAGRQPIPGIGSLQHEADDDDNVPK